MQNVVIGTLTLYEVFAYFFLYSFLGWIAEVAFHAVSAGKFINRGFLNGPVCSIYGVGVVVILLALGDWAQKPWAVFLAGVVIPTLCELITGWVLETFFHDKWWDYSTRKLNFKGYICLEFSLLWGLAVLFVVDVIHPFIRLFANLFGNIAGTVLVSVALAALVADMIVTLLQVLKLNQKLKEIDSVANAMRKGSDAIGSKVADITLVAEKGALRVKETVVNQRDRAVDAIVKKMPKRLLKAFPHLASRANPESVPLAKESMARLKKNKKREKEEAVQEVAVASGEEHGENP